MKTLSILLLSSFACFAQSQIDWEPIDNKFLDALILKFEGENNVAGYHALQTLQAVKSGMAEIHAAHRRLEASKLELEKVTIITNEPPPKVDEKDPATWQAFYEWDLKNWDRQRQLQDQRFMAFLTNTQPNSWSEPQLDLLYKLIMWAYDNRLTNSTTWLFQTDYRILTTNNPQMNITTNVLYNNILSKPLWTNIVRSTNPQIKIK